MILFTTNPILIAAAVIPAVWLLLYIYRKDRLEPEPPKLLLRLVLSGILSTLAAIVLELLGGWILSALLPEGTRLYYFVECFLLIGGAEEGAKYLQLKRKTWNSPSFNCQFDGVVYAVFVSLGFALWENIGYVAAYGLGTALLRAVTAVPGHACFGVFMGAWYGQARHWSILGDEQKSRRCRRLAVLVPMLLHGAYDYIAMTDADGSSWIFAIFVALLFLLSVRRVRRLSKEDRYL